MLRSAGCSSGTGVGGGGGGWENPSGFAALNHLPFQGRCRRRRRRGYPARTPRLAFAFRLSCVSIGMFCVRLTPAVCRARQTETACGRLRFCSARVGIAGRAFSDVVRLSSFVGSLGACVFLCGDPDERTKSATRHGCAFAKTHWPCHVFRGEYAGAARPRLRQRVIDSLDSLHLVRGVGAFLRKPINLAVFSAGSTLGLRAPNLRQRVFDSLDSLHLVRGVGAFLRKPISLAVFSAGSTLGLKSGSRTAAVI